MTSRTLVRKLGCDVIRMFRLVEILFMTLEALRVFQTVIAVEMAALACCCPMRPFKRKRCRGMIESGRFPSIRSVACYTVMWEKTFCVTWISDPPEILFMTCKTILRQRRTVLPVFMALLARCGRMPAC